MKANLRLGSLYALLLQIIDRIADFVADLLIFLFPVVIKSCRAVYQNIIQFFSFFFYLNPATLRQVIKNSLAQRLPGFSSEMAYQATLALFPGLLALLVTISFFESLQSQLYQMAALLGKIVPEQVEGLVKTGINQFSLKASPGLLSFSFLASLWVFSGVISSAMIALNHIHQVPREHLRPFWKDKLIALGLALGTILLLVLASTLVLISDLIIEALARQSCIIETVGKCNLEELAICVQQPPVQDCLLQSKMLETWQQLRWPITLGIVSTNYALIYRYGPSQRKPRTPLMPGAILASVLWAFISILFRWYVYHFGNFNMTYGAIGAFVILLLWLQMSSLIMLIGAQLNVTVGEVMESKLRMKNQESEEGRRIKN